MRGRVDVCRGRGESVLDYVIWNEEVWEGDIGEGGG